MARIFTLNCPFQDKALTALVSIKHCGYNLLCIVRYMNEDVDHIIPGGKLMFDLTGEIVYSTNTRSDLAEELICRTTHAISEHLS
ncbi:MAG TPA: hypothetical protein VFR58_17540 [Flavisolibacter sp.]|nr:hypothetical protein [Flavisolibacter sp.]